MDPDDGQRNCPKYVQFDSKNKFEKLVHLVGFVIRIYYDARSPERKISGFSLFLWLSLKSLFLHEIPSFRYQQLIPHNICIPLDGTVQCSSDLGCYKFSTSKQLSTFRRKITRAVHF